MKSIARHAALLFGFSVALAPGLFGQTAPVRIDGLIDEWEGSPADYTDPKSDGSPSADFGRLWIGSDTDYLFIAAEFGAEIGLQSDNNVTLYLDTDLNAATGQAVSGIGAELVWNFGERSGRYRSGSSSRTVSPSDVGIVTAPTVTSDFFEIAFELDVEPAGLSPLFIGDSLRLLLADGSGGDRLPDAGEVLTLPIARSTPTRQGPVDLAKGGITDIRILTYNVEADGLFSAGFTGAYGRMLNGLAPEIMVFVEIRNHTAEETAERIESLYSAGDGAAWFAAGAGTDIVIVSKYPVLETYDLQRANPNGFGNRAFLVDPGDAYPRDLLIVGAHLPCCSEDSRRQLEADEIMAFIRDGILDGSIASDTPIIITGDLNLVGDAQQLVTLVAGEIVSPAYQPSFPPDWDGSDLDDLIPGTTGTPLTYTWTGQGFSPGRLDFFIYTDAVTSVGNAFALDTSEMTLEEQAAFGLRRSDTSVSDHLPIVADFRFALANAAVPEAPSRSGLGLIEAIFPSPVDTRFTLRLRDQLQGMATIQVYDALGRRVGARLETSLHASGTEISIPIDLPPGVYLVRVTSGSQIDSRAIVVGIP